MATTPVIRHRSQVGTRAGSGKRLVHSRGAESTGGMEIGVDHLAVVRQHLAGGSADGIPGLIGFHGDAEIHLIARIGIRVKAKSIPPATVLDCKRARHDGLGEHRSQLVGPARADFRWDDARDVALDVDAIHYREPPPPPPPPRPELSGPPRNPAARHPLT